MKLRRPNASQNPYQLFGVAPDCDFATLKAAYRALVRASHPDLALDAADHATRTQRTIEINIAWHLVRDPQTRAVFDARQREVAEREARRREHQRNRQQKLQKRTPQNTGKTTAPDVAATQRAELKQTEKRGHKAGATAKHRAGEKTRPGGKSSSNEHLAGHHMGQALRLFYVEDQPLEAEQLCLSILRLDFRHVGARELLSEIAAARGEWRRARALLRQAVDLAPDNLALRYKLAALERETALSTPTKPRSMPPSFSTDRPESAQFSDSGTDASFEAPKTRPSLWNRLFGNRPLFGRRHRL